jgi:DNA-binding transcriptional regulator YhcF (GntR family)
VMNRHLIHHMLRSSRTLGVDYESLIVWGVLAHQNVAHLMPPAHPPTQATTHPSDAPEQGRELRPVRIRDLHQITGIPRETIRRKLESLAKRGFVRRHPSAGWIVDRQSIEPDLREFTRESVRQFLACANQIQTLLERTIARLPARTHHAASRGSARHDGGRRRSRDTPSHDD